MKDRIGMIRRVLRAILGINLAVAGAKIVAGGIAGSVSILADGFHSLFDGMANVVALTALRWAHQGPDEEHPYGHHKIETLGTFAIGMMLGLTAVEVIREALSRLWHGTTPEIEAFQFAALLSTLALNIGVAWYERRQGVLLRSDLLLADSAHTRTDVFVTLGVLASCALVVRGWVWIDAVVALGVAGAIVRAGWRVIAQGLPVLLDATALPEEQVRKIVEQTPGIRQCHGIRSRGTPDHCFLDLRIHVPPEETVQRAHEIAHEAESRLRRAFPGLADVLIHIEPDTTDHP